MLLTTNFNQEDGDDVVDIDAGNEEADEKDTDEVLGEPGDEVDDEPGDDSDPDNM